MIKKLSRSSGNVLGFRASGKLTDSDYKEVYVPELKATVDAHGKARILIEMPEDFRGWDAHAMWDDIKLEPIYFGKVERIAMVGTKNWEKWMTRLSRVFTKAQVKYFGENEIEDAWKWIIEIS